MDVGTTFPYARKVEDRPSWPMPQPTSQPQPTKILVEENAQRLWYIHFLGLIGGA